MNVFYDRQREFESLERSFASGAAALYILYGRRRLGKTTLLRRFAAGLLRMTGWAPPLSF